ncbi:MAG: hemerythrin domain-containing protein [Phyllobacteriaceae bacterium]|nr:hemerythrin domain-containing protein [Phyllobacteriaceae bacterium]
MRICDLLEEIADSLPLHVDRLKCFYAATMLRTSVAIHQMDEDRGLFPLMRKHGALEDGVLASLDRLETEHMDDESLSSDIIDALENLARGKALQSVDGMSFMLRAFFDSHRRHILFENQIILPMARKILNADHLAEIEQVILENRSISKASFFSPSPCASAKAAFMQRNQWSD